MLKKKWVQDLNKGLKAATKDAGKGIAVAAKEIGKGFKEAGKELSKAGKKIEADFKPVFTPESPAQTVPQAIISPEALAALQRELADLRERAAALPSQAQVGIPDQIPPVAIIPAADLAAVSSAPLVSEITVSEVRPERADGHLERKEEKRLNG